MASTRNRNTAGDYRVEQTNFRNNLQYLSQPFYGKTETPYLPGNGLLVGRQFHGELAANGTDIESTLYGIGSTNLTGASFNAQPEIKTLASLNIAQWKPTQTLIPEPLSIQGGQRPYPNN